jgi:hypothetical protein
MAAKEGQRRHRDRKNGAAREAWEKRKQAANTARPKQVLENGVYTRG